MANEIFNLRKEHENFRKLLSLLDEQLDLLHKGEDPDYPLMRDIIYYITQYYDISLHPKEELIFSFLSERDPSVKESVAEFTKEHFTIEQFGAYFYKNIENIINSENVIIKRQELEAPGHQYISTLRTHMDKEEQGLFILAEQLLTDADWKKIKIETLSKPDPIFGKAIDDRFHKVCNQLARLASNK